MKSRYYDATVVLPVERLFPRAVWAPGTLKAYLPLKQLRLSFQSVQIVAVIECDVVDLTAATLTLQSNVEVYLANSHC